MWADTAHAQYKNNIFGMDIGGWFIQRPSVLTEDGDLKAPNARPLRLANGIRFGGDFGFKLVDSHWWMNIKMNLGLLRYAFDQNGTSLQNDFDRAAASAVGTVFAVNPVLGIRYYFLTDRIRPYAQLGASYMALFSFSNTNENLCADATVCDTSATNINNFLPRRNIMVAHVQPGIEFIVVRDIAIHLYLDLQHWFVFSGPDSNALVAGIGSTFFG